MSTPEEHLADAADALAGWVENATPRERLDMLNEVMDSGREFNHRAGVLRAEAMREFVDEVGGGTKAARELEMSRNRVYQIMNQSKEGS